MRKVLLRISAEVSEVLARARRNRGKDVTTVIVVWLAFAAAIREVSRPSPIWIVGGATVSVVGLCMRMPPRHVGHTVASHLSPRNFRAMGLALLAGPFVLASIGRLPTGLSPSAVASDAMSITTTTQSVSPGSVQMTSSQIAPNLVSPTMATPTVSAQDGVTAKPTVLGNTVQPRIDVSCLVSLAARGPDVTACDGHIAVTEFGAPITNAAAWSLPQGASVTLGNGDVLAEVSGPLPSSCYLMNDAVRQNTLRHGTGDDWMADAAQTVRIDRMPLGTVIVLFAACDRSNERGDPSSGWILTAV
jgi:hypothetical protein